jgi:hypothetical protein
VLRRILRHCGVDELRLIPLNLRALTLELFSLPSESAFTQVHQLQNPGTKIFFVRHLF